jgi:hypothetical protein
MYFPMPTLGSPSIPYFKGVNITDFLETFIELYKDYNIKKKDLKTKLIKYYNIT